MAEQSTYWTRAGHSVDGVPWAESLWYGDDAMVDRAMMDPMPFSGLSANWQRDSRGGREAEGFARQLCQTLDRFETPRTPSY